VVVFIHGTIFVVVLSCFANSTSCSFELRWLTYAIMGIKYGENRPSCHCMTWSINLIEMGPLSYRWIVAYTTELLYLCVAFDCKAVGPQVKLEWINGGDVIFQGVVPQME
jgi:hypothetical protein